MGGLPGQLKWLKAHLVRENALLLGLLPMHAGSSSEELARAAKSVNDPELKWLTSFVEQHAEEGEKYPNPYFGGTNPLHLGLVSINR